MAGTGIAHPPKDERPAFANLVVKFPTNAGPMLHIMPNTSISTFFAATPSGTSANPVGETASSDRSNLQLSAPKSDNVKIDGIELATMTTHTLRETRAQRQTTMQTRSRRRTRAARSKFLLSPNLARGAASKPLSRSGVNCCYWSDWTRHRPRAPHRRTLSVNTSERSSSHDDPHARRSWSQAPMCRRRC